jgi:hypothetical protein
MVNVKLYTTWAFHIAHRGIYKSVREELANKCRGAILQTKHLNIILDLDYNQKATR